MKRPHFFVAAIAMLTILTTGCASSVGAAAAIGESSEQQLIKQIEQDLERMEKSSTTKVI